jgi:chemotaxis receptor (MCP) glutamine deamidase CheD
MYQQRQSTQSSCERSEVVVAPDQCRVAREGTRLVARRVLSDVVVAIHVPAAGLAAMLRFTCPDSRGSDAPSGGENPWSFGDPGIALFLESIGSLACRDRAVYVIGGADFEYGGRTLQLGLQNRLTAQRMLWREGVLPRGEDLGGSQARSIWLDASSGRLIVRTAASPSQSPRPTAPRSSHAT